ncbi:MAG: extracellular solute-binding protein [Planctomycetes bacterium]|nr:extracellular solute-binding protein [Planctomycetota bacterium]
MSGGLGPFRKLGCLWTIALWTIALACSGCSNSTDSAGVPAQKGAEKPQTQETGSDGGRPDPTRLMVIDDPALAETIRQQWSARADAELRVEAADWQPLRDATRLDADAVIFPVRLLGDLADRGLIMPLPSSVLDDPALAWRELFDLIRLREVDWGARTYAIPFGSAPWVLCYRADVLKAAGLEPPATWGEYLEMLPKLASRALSGEPAGSGDAPWHAVLEPLGDTDIVDLFLAHAAAGARHRSQHSTLFDYRTMQPLIDTPPFVEALTRMAKVAEVSPASLQMDQLAVVRAVIDGEAAMAVTRVTHAGTERIEASETRPIRFAELPGSNRAYSFFDRRWETKRVDESTRATLVGAAGQVGALVRGSRRGATALNTLRLLSGGEWSARVTPASRLTAPFRVTQQAQADAWLPGGLGPATTRSYYETVEASFHRSAYFLYPRLSGHEDYLAVLREKILAHLRGEMSAEAALNQVAERWAAITDERGLDSQRKSYRRSLGLEVRDQVE